MHRVFNSGCKYMHCREMEARLQCPNFNWCGVPWVGTKTETHTAQ